MLTVCPHTVFAISMLGLVAISANALAQESKVEAETLFREGREALGKGDYVTACEKFRQSNELDPAPGTQLNWGECEAQRGRVATAYFLFLGVERQLNETDVRAPIAHSKRESAEKRLPKLAIKLPPGAPLDTRVQILDHTFTPTELLEPQIFDPGTLEVVITAPGYVAERLRVPLEEGKTTNVVATALVPSRPLPLPVSPVPNLQKPQSLPNSWPSAAVAEQQTPSRSRFTGSAFLGVGIAAGALGGVFGIVTLEAKQTNQAHCDPVTQTCDSTGRSAASRGQLFGGLTTAALVTGGIGISVGTYLLLHERSDRPKTHVRLQSLGAGAALSVQHSF